MLLSAKPVYSFHWHVFCDVTDSILFAKVSLLRWCGGRAPDGNTSAIIGSFKCRSNWSAIFKFDRGKKNCVRTWRTILLYRRQLVTRFRRSKLWHISMKLVSLSFSKLRVSCFTTQHIRTCMYTIIVNSKFLFKLMFLDLFCYLRLNVCLRKPK